MIEWIAAGFLVVGFLILFRVFSLAERGKQIFPIVQESLDVIRSKTLDDDAKEAAVQKSTKQLVGLFFVLAAGGAVALFVPVGVLWLADKLDLVSLQSVLDLALSLKFIIASSIAAIAVLFLLPKPSAGDNRYTLSDRIMHKVAFKTYVAQIPVADIEHTMFAGKLASCDADRPVFITALPRAGTTLLLESLAQMPELASHRYRDMPFVLTPCLWNQFSAGFRQSSELRERAHGDGMMINADSPEALEEVVWKTFWRKHYLNDRIVPWKDGERSDEFEEFFPDHMRKIILVRRGEDAPDARYVSKNNPNISRVGWLRKHFPEATIVVPVRDPFQHALSLLRQHRNFLTIQEDDPFASEYMRAIGHFDFGENLRPIDFDGWLDRRTGENATELTFWLEYWVAAYGHLLRDDADRVHFLDYDGLCAHPDDGLRALADTIGARHTDPLLSVAPTIRQAKPRDVDTSAVPESILRNVRELHAELTRITVNRSGPKDADRVG